MTPLPSGWPDPAAVDAALRLFGHDPRPPTAERVLLALIVSFFLALFVVFVYKRTYRGVLAARNLHTALVLTALVTTLVVVPISSNLTLSLGMVGALSIVRFRTAIKDQVDIVFTFWAITIGVACGAGFYVVATLGSALVGLFLAVFTAWQVRDREPYLLVVRYDPAAEARVVAVVGDARLRSKTRTGEVVELTVEYAGQGSDTTVLDRLLAIDGVRDGSIVAFEGDFGA